MHIKLYQFINLLLWNFFMTKNISHKKIVYQYIFETCITVRFTDYIYIYIYGLILWFGVRLIIICIQKLRTNLASQRAKAKGVQQTSATDFTQIRTTFTGIISLRLRSLIEEENFGTVYHVSLNSHYIQNLLNLGHPNNIMVRWSPNLHYIYKFI